MMTLERTDHKLVNILLVDDRPQNLVALEETLAEVNANFVKVSSGAEALKQLLQQEFALILLDIQMPDMDGFEVARIVRQRERTRHIPIIFLTAVYDSSDFVREGYSLGAIDYLLKPIVPEVLIAKVTELMKIFNIRHQLETQLTYLETTNQHWHQLSTSLDWQLQQRNAELQQSLKFELTLRHITEKVRDSLDEAQILQVAVQELAIALNALACHATLYDPVQRTATVTQSYSIVLPSCAGQVHNLEDSPELYAQLQQPQPVHFCTLFPDPDQGLVSNLVCPIHNGCVLGDLWIIHAKEHTFTALELQLAEQVASQCMIAVRQSRLYQASQSYVTELQALNQLKDDFLSTISHELKTPIANMKMAIQMLEIEAREAREARESRELRESSCPDEAHGHPPSKAHLYLQILAEECDRENKLLGDLLLIQHLEAKTHSLQLVELCLQDWLIQVVEPFSVKMKQRQQILTLEISEDLPPLVVDTFSLSHLLTELLNNAHKYTPPGETITVTAQLTAASEIQIGVTNFGIEIPADQQARIFDKFYRIPNHDPWKHGGTGLGLALAQRLAEYCGGHLQVTSHSGMTCFTVTLPPQAIVAPDSNIL